MMPCAAETQTPVMCALTWKVSSQMSKENNQGRGQEEEPKEQTREGQFPPSTSEFCISIGPSIVDGPWDLRYLDLLPQNNPQCRLTSRGQFAKLTDLSFNPR